MASNIPVNSLAEQHYKTKIMRAIERRPNLSRKIYSDFKPLVVEDENGKFNSFAVRLDGERLERCLINIARGLYYHAFSERWLGNVKAVCNFVLGGDSELGNTYNDVSGQLKTMADMLLSGIEPIGENRDVFSFKIVKTDHEQLNAIAQLTFYGGSIVTLMYRK